MPQVLDIRLMVRAEQPVLSARMKASYKDMERLFAEKREVYYLLRLPGSGYT